MIIYDQWSNFRLNKMRNRLQRINRRRFIRSTEEDKRTGDGPVRPVIKEREG